MSCRSILPALFALIGLAAFCNDARAGTLTTTLTLADLPTSITLCRDSTAIAQFQVDEQWQIGIDVDGNTATGDPSANGIDVLLLVVTLPQMAPCSPTVVTLNASALLTDMLVWNSGTQSYDDAGPFTVSVDTTANTLTLTNDIAGPLAGFGSQSRLYAAAVAGYTQSGTPTFASDAIVPTGPDVARSDPAGDVSGCSSPCSAAAAYYPMIDITGFDAGTGLLARDIGNLKVQFALAGLPASITLCRDPSQFASGTNADTLWYAGIDVDANPATGLNGIDAVVLVYTQPQNPGCTTHTASTAGALLGEIDTLDGSGMQTYVGDATISVDTAKGIITALIPYDSSALKGLSSAAAAEAGTSSLYAFGQPDASAHDSSISFGIDSEFSDPLQDVANCSGSCTTSVYWYPQTDLVGGSVVRADRVFQGNFE